VKGKDKTIKVYAPMAFNRKQEVKSIQLEGRTNESRVIMEELVALQQGGPGRVVWIEGPAGIGKSVLVRNFYRMATLNGHVSRRSALLGSTHDVP
jgi:Cdc6-like AAA superfamily ATPase